MVRALWTLTALLVVIGVSASVGRLIFPTDLAYQTEPLRVAIFELAGARDPFASERGAELARFEGRYAHHAALTRVHVIAGGVFLLLAPLQFIPRVRSRWPSFHRWSGRALLIMAVVISVPGLYFGLLIPFAGVWEVRALAMIGVSFVGCLATAWIAIRKGQRDRHREWMIRAFALAISIAAMRVVVTALDVPATVAGIRPYQLFALGIWIGWLLSVGAAEIWIRRTRVIA